MWFIIQIALGIVLAVIILDLLRQPELCAELLCTAVLWMWYGVKIISGTISLILIAAVTINIFLDGVLHLRFMDPFEMKLAAISAAILLAINSIGKRFSIIWNTIEEEKKKNIPKSYHADLDF